LASFYSKFVINLIFICAPIVETIKRNKQPFQWTEVADKRFKLLKQKIIEQPILDLLDFNKLFQVKCDASGIAIGSI